MENKRVENTGKEKLLHSLRSWGHNEVVSVAAEPPLSAKGLCKVENIDIEKMVFWGVFNVPCSQLVENKRVEKIGRGKLLHSLRSWGHNNVVSVAAEPPLSAKGLAKVENMDIEKMAF